MLDQLFIERTYLNKLNNTDLFICRCGVENCEPLHFWGPAVRDSYLIHYILDGMGTFQSSGTTYKLEKGQGFLIYPNNVSFHQADSIHPWTCAWIAFKGVKVDSYLKRAGLSIHNPIFEYNNDDYLSNCIDQMLSFDDTISNPRELSLLGLLYLFFGKLIEINEEIYNADKNENPKDIYIKKCIEFIALNYSRKISITELSNYIGLERSYVYSIFKNYLKISPQQYLTNFKIAKACELMGNKLLSLGDISRSVGYENPLIFSKIFKKIKGISPREYRKRSS